MLSWLEEAEKLEQKAKSFRNLHTKKLEAKQLVQIGTHIYDLDANKVALVKKLTNGSNDFEANYVDRSYSRGYHFVVENWRIATEEEIKMTLN